MCKIYRNVQRDENSQAIAKYYVLQHPLSKPKTTVIIPILIALSNIALAVGIGFGLLFLPIDIAKETWYKVLAFLIPCLVIFTIGLRPFLIAIVKCYQHYTKPERRKACVCKPTCSEYALLVLHKDLIFIAIYRIIYRLTVTCKGDAFCIDEPFPPKIGPTKKLN